ncbi:MAG: penicillin-binding protein 1C [Shimia sp.]
MRWFAAALILFAVGAGRDAVDAWIDATVLPPLVPEVSDEVRAADGTLLRAYTVEDGLWRLGVSAAEVDPDFVAALIAYEDKRFAHHSGVDPRAALRAAWQALRAGRVVSGGSTLSMQVARLLEDGGTGRWAGKARQVRVALALERRVGKGGVLDLYLHHAPYGGNLEGVRAASLAWFGRDPARLTPAQIALLVALPQAPEARRPDRHPEAAARAVSRVMDRLVAAGVMAEEAVPAPVPRTMRGMPMRAPHMADRWRGTGAALTLDPRLQAAVEGVAARAALRMGRGRSVAILVAEHGDGAVRAAVGSAGYGAAREGFVDMTRAVRSPGSTLKPLVHAMAFDAGLAHPETILPDRPHDFGGWRPANFDGAFRGEVTARAALRDSLNVPVVHLADAIGPARLMAAMRASGMAPELDSAPGLAVALGGVGVRLEGLVRLYGMLARGGAEMPYHVAVGAAPDVRGPRVVGAAAAWHVLDTLREVPPPPGYAAGRIAYKTGTSYGHRDAWAIGVDGRWVVGVWTGRPDGTPVPGAFGAAEAAPLLFDVFGSVEHVPLPPPPPEAITVGAADLPRHLRRFGPTEAARPSLTLAFPPDGAILEGTAALPVRVGDGVAPFTWLADGAPVAAGPRRDAVLPVAGPGFVTVTVLDATGASGRARVRILP